MNRDIKLENTLLDNSPRPLVKICDFGYSKHEKFQSAPGSRVGTPAYLAPEVILTTKGKTYDGKVWWLCYHVPTTLVRYTIVSSQERTHDDKAVLFCSDHSPLVHISEQPG